MTKITTSSITEKRVQETKNNSLKTHVIDTRPTKNSDSVINTVRPEINVAQAEELVSQLQKDVPQAGDKAIDAQGAGLSEELVKSLLSE